MAKSRIAGALLAALLFTPAEIVAQTVAPPVVGVDAQALIDAQRAQLTDGARIGCRRSTNPEEITVCGTRDNRRYRVPDVIEAGEIRTSSRAGGEQLSALSNDRCLRLCHQPVGVTLIDTGGGSSALNSAARLIEQLEDDE